MKEIEEAILKWFQHVRRREHVRQAGGFKGLKRGGGDAWDCLGDAWDCLGDAWDCLGEARSLIFAAHTSPQFFGTASCAQGF